MFHMKRNNIYIPLCLYLYERLVAGEASGNKFTFHYVYIYMWD